MWNFTSKEKAAQAVKGMRKVESKDELEIGKEMVGITTLYSHHDENHPVIVRIGKYTGLDRFRCISTSKGYAISLFQYVPVSSLPNEVVWYQEK